MRTLTAAALAEIAKQYGTEPINIVEIEWVEGTHTIYSDKTIDNIPGKIIEISNLDEVINLLGSSNSATINIKLDDTDQTIKTLMNQYDIHKRTCRVYQIFQGLDTQSDKFLIFKGEISSPIIWDYGKREIQFEVISQIESGEVGFTPEEGQFKFVSDELAGRVWPLCFGNVVHVPATRSQEVLVGNSLTLFGFADTLLPLKKANGFESIG